MSDVDKDKLARMLRECAVFVERNDFHTAMFQVISDLNLYISKHPKNAATPTNESHGREIQKVPSSLSAGMSGITNVLGKIGIVDAEKGKASSVKNAERVRADLQEYSMASGSYDSGSVGSSDRHALPPRKPAKPAFQRSSNPESTLIASGWLEQQRRSKFRVVWKDILATIVEAQTPKQETTFWIQREINTNAGKRELEALHKVPIKWIKEVLYFDHLGDHRFSVKVFNISEDFVFRCADAASAQDWVVTLRSVKENNAARMQALRETAASRAEPVAMAVPVEAKPTHSTVVPAYVHPAPHTTPTGDRGAHEASEARATRMTIKEMQNIAHAAGVKTSGMERPDLERVVAMIRGQSNVTADVPSDEAQMDAGRTEHVQVSHVHENGSKASGTSTSVGYTDQTADADDDDDKRRHLQETQAQWVAEARRKATLEEEKRNLAILEEQRRKAMIAEELRQVEQQKKIVEEQMRQAAVAEKQRRRVMEQEIKRQEEERLRAQQELLRRQEEERLRAQQQYQQAQQQWQAQQAAQQQWQSQQAAAQRAQAAQWQQWQQQQQQQQQQHQQPQQPQQQQQPPKQPFPQQQQGPTEPSTSSADMKYTKMATESAGGEAVTINAVKRNILTHWALQPPNLQHLRSICDLLMTIHKVFPPAFGVPGHDHFKKWTPITRQELIPVGAVPDPEKLNKSVKKLRFFLHPDKLPRDLTEEQLFMCRMLWDVSSDAWEEYKKRHEELDWMR